LKSNPVTEQNISGLRRWGNRCRYIPDAKASGYQDCIRSGCPATLQIMLLFAANKTFAGMAAWKGACCLQP
ncbi:MAG: hypothetical protein LBL94_06225, partial [Prevotellaceae bacterium]|nr:hypothetical protein [Prevotellaceae bacterium]